MTEDSTDQTDAATSPDGEARPDDPVEAADSSAPLQPILARATVKLAGVRLGWIGHVDPRVPFVHDCLERGFLVPVEPEPTGDSTDDEVR